jgi:hypothetical protein
LGVTPCSNAFAKAFGVPDPEPGFSAQHGVSFHDEIADALAILAGGQRAQEEDEPSPAPVRRVRAG